MSMVRSCTSVVLALTLFTVVYVDAVIDSGYYYKNMWEGTNHRAAYHREPLVGTFTFAPAGKTKNPRLWEEDKTYTLVRNVYKYSAYFCDNLQLDIVPRATHWEVTIRNFYSCDCQCDYYSPPYGCPYNSPSYCMTWNPPPPQVMYPAVITFYDLRDVAPKVLQTRHVSENRFDLLSQQWHIHDALDIKLVASAMKMEVTFFQPQIVRFIVNSLSYFMNTPQWHSTYIWSYDTRYESWNDDDYNMGLGLELKRDMIPSYSQVWHLRRKPPVPPYVLQIWRNSQVPYPHTNMQMNCWLRPVLTWVMPNYTYSYAHKTTRWGSSSYITCPYYGSYSNLQFGFRLEYFEPVRWYMGIVNFTYTDLDAMLPTPGTSATFITDVSMGEPHSIRNASFRLQVQVKRFNIERGWGSVSVPADKMFALYILQPFPIQDLWVEVRDRITWKRVFLEMEYFVPEIPDTALQQVGWHWALDFGRQPSDTLSAIIRFNRRPKVGLYEEEVKCKTLLHYLEAVGGNTTTYLISPIPRIILQKPNLLGVVMSRDVTENTDVGIIEGINTTVLHWYLAAEWFEENFGPQFRFNQTWNNLTVNPELQWNTYVNASGNWSHIKFESNHSYYRRMERLNLTLFTVLRGVNPRDHTTGYWLLWDSFHPDAPEDIPILLDDAQIEALFGWGEFARFLHERRANWTIEYEMISGILPWLPTECSLDRWFRTHAWVMRNSYEVKRTASYHDSYMIIPGVNLMRQGTPNIDIIYENLDGDGRVRLRAKRDMVKYTELHPNYSPETWIMHEYFFTYGIVPSNSISAATLPTTNRYLLGGSHLNTSRWWMAEEFAIRSNVTIKEGLNEVLTLVDEKLLDFPTLVDAVGSPPTLVTAATALLDAERSVLTEQSAIGWDEYNDLP